MENLPPQDLSIIMKNYLEIEFDQDYDFGVTWGYDLETTDLDPNGGRGISEIIEDD